MSTRLQTLYEQMAQLERNLAEELQHKRTELEYKIEHRRIIFDAETLERHKRLAKRIPRFLYDSGIVGIAIAPLMYSMVVPLAFLDVSMTVFQAVVFTHSRIPKTNRGEFIVIDRHKLGYLNYFEKLNCVYCGYANGVVARAREIISRTEKHWCPIRHARTTRAPHAQYASFLDYGDAETYRAEYEKIRNVYDV